VTTAIAVYTSEGCVGRCDAKCHQAAPGTPCDCVCGGRLHSVGREQAIAENTRDFIEAAERWCKEHGVEEPDVVFYNREQLALFDSSSHITTTTHSTSQKTSTHAPAGRWP